MSLQKAEIELLKKHQKPEYNGPGIWYCIHTKAAKVKSLSDMREGIAFIKTLIEGFKCPSCQNHAMDYEKLHPLTKCLECRHNTHKGGMEMCLFKWTVDFHNAVNSRLQKPIIGYELAYEFYSDNMYLPCESGCGDGEKGKAIQPAQVYFTKSFKSA